MDPDDQQKLQVGICRKYDNFSSSEDDKDVPQVAYDRYKHNHVETVGETPYAFILNGEFSWRHLIFNITIIVGLSFVNFIFKLKKKLEYYFLILIFRTI